MIQLDESYHYLPSINIQRKVKIRRVYPRTINPQHILSRYQYCNLCETNVIIDKNITGKTKMTLADIIRMEFKDQLMKNHADVNSDNDSLPTYTFIEP